MTARITEVTRLAKLEIAPRIGAASKRTKGGIKAFRKAAAMMDQRRREQSAVTSTPSQ